MQMFLLGLSLTLFPQHPFCNNLESLRTGRTHHRFVSSRLVLHYCRECYCNNGLFFFILSGFESILEGLFGPALLKDLSLFKGIQNLFFSFFFSLWYFKFFLVTYLILLYLSLSLFLLLTQFYVS